MLTSRVEILARFCPVSINLFLNRYNRSQNKAFSLHSTGKTSGRERLSTVDLLVKVAYFETKIINRKSCSSKQLTRKSTVQSLLLSVRTPCFLTEENVSSALKVVLPRLFHFLIYGHHSVLAVSSIMRLSRPAFIIPGQKIFRFV